MNKTLQATICIILVILIVVYFMEVREAKSKVAHSSPFQHDGNTVNITVQNIYVTGPISSNNEFSIKKIVGEQVIVGEKNISHQSKQTDGKV